MNLKDTFAALMKSHMAGYYGDSVAEVYDDIPAVCDVIQPDQDATVTGGFRASKAMFQDPAFMMGYTLCTPHDLKRGDRVRYAVKKRGAVKWIFGGAVKWVDGMLADDGSWEDRSALIKPKYITLCNPKDAKRSWSVQLSGQRVYLFRMPFVTQRDRAKAVEGIELINQLETEQGTAREAVDHLVWFSKLTSDDLFELARQRKREETFNKRNNVKVV